MTRDGGTVICENDYDPGKCSSINLYPTYESLSSYLFSSAYIIFSLRVHVRNLGADTLLPRYDDLSPPTPNTIDTLFVSEKIEPGSLVSIISTVFPLVAYFKITNGNVGLVLDEGEVRRISDIILSLSTSINFHR